MQEYTFKIPDIKKRHKFHNTEIHFKILDIRNENMHFTVKIKQRKRVKQLQFETKNLKNKITVAFRNSSTALWEPTQQTWPLPEPRHALECPDLAFPVEEQIHAFSVDSNQGLPGLFSLPRLPVILIDLVRHGALERRDFQPLCVQNVRPIQRQGVQNDLGFSRQAALRVLGLVHCRYDIHAFHRGHGIRSRDRKQLVYIIKDWIPPAKSLKWYTKIMKHRSII
jgi:hypothetical protein